MTWRSVGRSIIAAGASLHLLGCAEREPQEVGTATLFGQRPVHGPREIVATAWDTLWRVAGSEAGGLSQPTVIRWIGDQIVVLDAADRLVALSTRGMQKWERRAAPGHRGRVFSAIAADDRGTVYVLNEHARAIQAMSRRGDVTREIPLPVVTPPEFFTPLGGGRFALLSGGWAVPIAVIDSSGRLRASASFEWSGYADLHPLARQLRGVSDGRGRWAALFLLGNGWFPYQGSDASGPARAYVRHREFPRVRVRSQGERTAASLAGYSPCTACDASLEKDRVLVLAGESNESARALIDEYEWRTGRYVRSLRLPSRATTFAVRGDTVIAALATEEGYRVFALHPRNRGASQRAAGARTSAE